jgi:CHAT domain-containing protein
MNLLQPVPQSSGEAHQIATLFGPSSVVLEGARATRSELRNEGVQQTRILHFATHGLIDEARPDRSGLLLTADPPHDDGLLQVRDIDSMRLNADLVTLSACETALGQNVTGEGVVGLTRAFFIAGARSVVASLWDVDDASTSRFMKRFYVNIRNGEAIDLALQHAKLQFIRDGGATTSPFYWASFVASGNARTVIPAPEQPSGEWKVRITILALLAAALYFWIVSLRRGEVMNGRP